MTWRIRIAKRRLLAAVLVTAAFALFATHSPAIVAQSASGAPPTYHLVDLGPVGGTLESEAWGINSAGTIAGDADDPTPGSLLGSPFPVIWSDKGGGQGSPLGPDNVVGSDFPVGINDAGVIVDSQVFRWIDGHRESLAPLIQAAAINNAGQIAGSVRSSTGQVIAAVWDHGVVTALPSPGASRASGINDTGEVIGQMNVGFGYQAVRWYNGTLSTLPSPSFNPAATRPSKVNASGQVAGWILPLHGTSHALLWQADGAVTQLPQLSPHWGAFANSINDAGDIVGSSGSDDADSWYGEAALWHEGQIYDLNELIPSGSGFTLATANDINNAGEIVGIGYYMSPQHKHDVRHGFLLIPDTAADTTAPVVHVPSSPVTVEATGANGAAVTFAVTEDDPDDGPLPVACAPASGSVFPLGSTDVMCSSTDAAGNVGHAGFTVVVQDTTPPDILVPPDIHVDATSPQGAAVSYFAGAIDLVDGQIALVSCIPASGSTFPIGTTVVNCSAYDQHNNKGEGSFKVYVKSAADQMKDLVAYVAGHQAGPGASLISKLNAASDALNANQTPAACGSLGALINEARAQSGKKVAPDVAAYVIAAATRIRAVLGC